MRRAFADDARVLGRVVSWIGAEGGRVNIGIAVVTTHGSVIFRIVVGGSERTTGALFKRRMGSS